MIKERPIVARIILWHICTEAHFKENRTHSTPCRHWDDKEIHSLSPSERRRCFYLQITYRSKCITSPKFYFIESAWEMREIQLLSRNALFGITISSRRVHIQISHNIPPGNSLSSSAVAVFLSILASSIRHDRFSRCDEYRVTLSPTILFEQGQGIREIYPRRSRDQHELTRRGSPGTTASFRLSTWWK